MGDPRRVRPDELEIIVARELRKAGVTISALAVVARNASQPIDAGEYSVEFAAVTGDGDALREALIECRNETAPIGVTAVRALDARRSARRENDGPVRLLDAPSVTSAAEARGADARLAIMFSVSGYEREAVREAMALGIALLAITDGPAAFRRSQCLRISFGGPSGIDPRNSASATRTTAERVRR